MSSQENSQATRVTRLIAQYKFNGVFIFLDFILRVALCIWFFFYGLNAWIFVAAQIGMTMLESLLNGKYENKLSERIRKQLDGVYNPVVEEVEIATIFPGWIDSVYIWGGLVVSCAFFYSIISPEAWYTYFLIAILGISFVAFFVEVPSLTAVNRHNLPDSYIILEEKIINAETKDIKDLTSFYPKLITTLSNEFDDIVVVEEYDLNDAKIAKLESELKGINSRVDAYMLESVLLGALAFSGFLTIIAANIVSSEYDSFNSSVSEFYNSVTALMSGDLSIFQQKLAELFARQNLFLFIMVQSLICSVFFILVLALRLRFSDLSLKMDYLLRIMSIFNGKEEELVNMKMQSQGNSQIDNRLKAISKKIEQALIDCEKLHRAVVPIVKLMGFLRNVGIGFFYLILITSGFYFSPLFAFCIFMLAVSTMLFRVIESKMKLSKISRLLHRH